MLLQDELAVTVVTVEMLAMLCVPLGDSSPEIVAAVILLEMDAGDASAHSHLPLHDRGELVEVDASGAAEDSELLEVEILLVD